MLLAVGVCQDSGFRELVASFGVATLVQVDFFGTALVGLSLDFYSKLIELLPGEGWISGPFPPPLAPAKAFSRSG